MNHSLEKLFLFCLVLFGLIILFLLGLYFDLGDILFAFLHPTKISKLGESVSSRMLEQTEKAALPRGVRLPNISRSTDRDLEGGPASGGAETEEAIAAYCGLAPQFTAAQEVAIKRQQLVAAGITDEELLEMESLGADRRKFNDVVAQVQQLRKDGHFGDAISVLLGALRQLDSKNMMVENDYQRVLVELYIETKQLDQARELSAKAAALHERIVRIQLKGYPEEEKAVFQQQLAEIEQLRKESDNEFRELQNRLDETGNTVTLTSKEKSDIKDEISQARQAGEISAGEYERLLKDVNP